MLLLRTSKYSSGNKQKILLRSYCVLTITEKLSYKLVTN